MISKSESLPITIETWGLLIESIASTSSLFQCLRRNVLTIMRAVKRDLRASLIDALQGRIQICCSRCYPQYASSGSIVGIVTFRSASVENLYASQICRIFEAADSLSRLVAPGIAAGGHHHTHGGIVRPFEIAIASASVDRSFHGLNQITFEPHQNRLRLGVAETAVEFEHHRAARSHHKPAIKNAFILRAFSFHAGNHRASDMVYEPIAHLFVDDSRRSVGAHTARIWPSVAFAGALMILGGDQWCHTFTITHDQKREFVALQKFFEHHARAGLAQHSAAEHLIGNGRGLVLTLGDDDALPGGEAIGLYNDWSMKVRQRVAHLFRRIANSVMRGRDVMTLQKLLGETLACFELRCGSRRPKRAPASSHEFVHHTHH